MSPMTMALEGLLALLLAACLLYCWRLDRKLAALRNGQDGVREAAGELLQAVAQAENAVRTLRATAQDAGRDLQARIDTARSLSDRLGLGLGRIRSSADMRPGR
ncbi:MAG: hypothetical protein GC206_03165 [Alphaproteobacteria bacterium]|nr:hypothetical protein [Alphaproteobacteria bacterium]